VTQATYGAQGDGLHSDTAAIQRAIDTCRDHSLPTTAHVEVVLPAGLTFLTGALNLTSFMTLRVEGTLLGSTDPADYPVVPALPGYGVCRDSGYPAANAGARHQALISGWHLRSVAVMGQGVVNGQGLLRDPGLNSSWESRQASNTLDYGRPRVYEPMFSSDMRLQNINITNQAFWAVHPYAYVPPPTHPGVPPPFSPQYASRE